MKYRLASILRCPECLSRVSLHVFKEEERFPNNNYQPESRICSEDCVFEGRKNCQKCASLEVISGLLTCECGNAYPIVECIPRIFPSAFADFPEFVYSFSKEISQIAPSALEKRKLSVREQLSETTKIVFGIQWKIWGMEKKIFGRSYQEIKEYMLNYLMPSYATEKYLSPERLILDAGCGHGLYVEILSKEYQTEVIGLELSQAAEVAWTRNSKNPTAHIIQGDILSPPFAQKTFDFVFSNGVIHHTPNTRMAFHQIAELVKTGGVCSIWVYPKWSWLWETVQGVIRAITTRIPPRWLYYLCYIPVPLLSIFPSYSHTKLGKASWRQCAQVVWDFYSPRYQTHHTQEEINQWFKEEGFTDVENEGPPITASGRKVRK